MATRMIALSRPPFDYHRLLRTTLPTFRKYATNNHSPPPPSVPPPSTSTPPPLEVPPTATASSTHTHFGFSEVPLQEKQGMVGRVFDSVASSYDMMNDAMSLGVHRLWKSAFVTDMAPTPGMRILDCAGGTADIALRVARATEGGAAVVVADINAEMLKEGRKRAKKAGYGERAVRFVEANAESLPFEDGEFDVYAISFGMRNVPRVEQALKEAFRVLKGGGRFMMLEFAKVNNAPASAVYDAYSFNVIPAIGRHVAGDEKAYQYLVESIRQFPAQEEFLDMVKKAGFMNATATDYSMGVAATYSAFKPMSADGDVVAEGTQKD